ncbi:MAG: hypothetical protein PF480_05710, partial [Roseovarius sp.]|nr:hypothetical protein [Roseovarius sp.]
ACSSTDATNAFDELTIAASNDGVLRKPVELGYPLQTRFLAVNGLLPVPHVGSTCLSSSFRPASSIICFAQTNETQVRVATYDYDGGFSDLTVIEKTLAVLQVRLLQLVKEDVEGVPPTSGPGSAQSITANVEELSSEMQKKNLFIFRWKSKSAANAGGSLGQTLFSGKAAFEDADQGVVIVGGLKLSQLLLGKDKNSYLGGLPDSAKIATFTLGSEYFLYSARADFSAALDAKFNGNLQYLSRKLSAETKAAINAYAAIGNVLENRGGFAAPAIKSYSLQEYEKFEADQQVFYSTMTDVETLVEALSKKPRKK